MSYGRAEAYRTLPPQEHVRGTRSWWKTAAVIAGIGAAFYLLWPSDDRHTEPSLPPGPGGDGGVSHGSAHVAITVRPGP